MDGEALRACIAEPAPAKINLCLHVLGRRADGYHELESLVAFADIGDRLIARPAEADRFTIVGPYAAALCDAGENLVLAAHRALGARTGLPPLDLVLEKNLPVASGIGGGSADAGAMLRIAARMSAIDGEDLFLLASGLGADVPACLLSRVCWMSGIGERLEPLAHFPRMPVVLVNPGIGVETGRVFAALAAGGRTAPAGPRPCAFADASALLAFLAATRNDLECPAASIQPEIRQVLAELEAAAGCRLARMSGSGATCFGLFEGEASARNAASRIAADRPDWWVASGYLEGAP